MAANFAPYQDIPETQRALSPLASPRTSVDRTRNISSVTSPPTRAYEQHDYFGAGDESPDTERVAWNTPASSQPLGFGAAREDVDMFTTSLGLRMDYEACLAAYIDAATLDRYEIPFFGSLANSILDDE
ncbi:hypothetical protein SLS61_006623 [Didymella pomorum]